MTKTKTRFLAVGLTMIVLIAALIVILSVGKTAGAENVWNGNSMADSAYTGTYTEEEMIPYTEKALSGTEDLEDCIVISTPEEFEALTKDKNAWGKNYALGNDISLAGITITSIGTDMNYPFTGKFSGNGHTISDVTINSADSEFVGLFGVNRGLITDLSVSGKVTGKNFVGGITGLNDTNCVITNCSFDGTVVGRQHIGGICGQNNGSISDGLSKGEINGAYNVGGVCGYNVGSISTSSALADVSGNIAVGGVCGYNSGDITRSFNEGEVSGTSIDAGGVCGDTEGSGTIMYCYNVGTVSGNSAVGGVCGRANSSVSACYSVGKVTGDSYDVGGVCGVGNSSNITNCYYNKYRCTERNLLGTGITSSELCGDTLPDGFSDSVWVKGSTTISTSGGKFRNALYKYPTLVGMTKGKYVVSTRQYNFGNGSDDWQDYLLITSAEEFAAIGKDELRWADNFVLFEDIDLKDVTIKPIGNENTPFSGKFSGDGCAIINVNSKAGGLFGYSSGLIEDIILESGNISGNDVTGSICNNNSGVIVRCGNGATIDAQGAVGGIAGNNTGTVSNCFNVGSVKGVGYAGGICVTNDGGVIENCYNAGEYKLSGNGSIGYICAKVGGTITNCWGTANPLGNKIERTDLLSSKGITEMGFDTSVWTKIPNDRGNQIAYYPSTSSRHAFSISYEVNLDFYQSGNATPVYLGDVVFYYSVSLKFSDYIPGSETPKRCTIQIGDRIIADSDVDLNRYSSYYTCTLDTVDRTTFTFWCDGTGSEFIPDELSKECTLNIEKREPAASDFDVVLSGLKYDGSAKSVEVNPAAGIVGMGDVTVHYYSDGKLLKSAPVNAGDYTFSIDVAAGTNYKAITGLTDSSWKFTIAKADAPEIIYCYAYYTFAESGDRKITVNKLPDDIGTVGTPTITVNGSIFKENSVRYSDGNVYFTLADNIALGNFGVITVKLPTQNYEDITINAEVGITDKHDRLPPELMDFDLVFTSKGSDITATIVTELSEVEFSFDGVNWSDVNTASVGHEQSVTGYIRFAETEIYNVSMASFKEDITGHGTLVHRARVEPDCTKEGNAEYWECTVCSKVFTDEDGTAETTREALVLAMTNHTEGPAVKENEIPATCTADGSYDEVIYCSVCKTQLHRERKTTLATGHKWSDKYESDKTGHWHKCESCGATTEVESHISSGPATVARAEVCTVCGYQIAPRKKSSGGSVGPGGGPKTPSEDKPAINGVEKSWTEIAAELAGQSGGSVVIALNGETVVPVDVIRAVMNNKIKVEFVVDSVKSWIVDGAKITTAAAADLTAIPGSADKGALRGVPGVDLITNGTGIPADLKLKFRKEFAGQFANVYMLTDGSPVFQGCVKVDEDGAAVISGAEAAGEYIVMVCEYSDLPGDMNNDGVLNAIDASSILKDIVGAAAGANPLMADFNGDGVSNALDASAILKYIVGIAA